MLTGEKVVVQGRAHTAHVQGAGGARGETDANAHVIKGWEVRSNGLQKGGENRWGLLGEGRPKRISSLHDGKSTPKTPSFHPWVVNNFVEYISSFVDKPITFVFQSSEP